MGEIVNKVASSGLVQIDLGELYVSGERIELDIADQLFQGLVLREKDFRAFIKEEDWSKYQGAIVNIICSADAIVPEWAYMLLATVLNPVAEYVGFGTSEEIERALFNKKLAELNLPDYEGDRVVVKGCGDKPVPTSAYVELVRLLQPVVKSIMFGEPCSTVPVYKQKRINT